MFVWVEDAQTLPPGKQRHIVVQKNDRPERV